MLNIVRRCNDGFRRFYDLGQVMFLLGKRVVPFDGVNSPRSALALVLGTNWESREVLDRRLCGLLFI